MRETQSLLTAVSVLAVMLLQPTQALHAQVDGAIALTGRVTSLREGTMEGVLVSAKKDGSTITTTVVTDRDGRYRFPRERLSPGRYALAIRATGYELDGEARAVVTPQETAAADLALRETQNLAAQLSNAEWLHSMPGTVEEKDHIRNCGHCHLFQLATHTQYDAEGWMPVLERMRRYPPLAFPLMPQVRPADRIGSGPPDLAGRLAGQRRQAETLATINLSTGPQWSYSLKTFPRPTGKGTQVIYTSYELSPPTRQPHDVIVDSNGMAWYASFGEQVLAKLDPDTGKLTEYEIPLLKPGLPTGVLAIAFDRAENVWMAMQFQGGVAKFDPVTEAFETWRVPEELDGDYVQITQLSPHNTHVDNKVWMVDAGTYTVLRLDTATGEFEVFPPFEIPRPNIYAVFSDKANNAYFTVMGREHIGFIDAQTGEIELHETPTPQSAPRRGMVAPDGRVWFGENRRNRIGMFDPETRQIKEWEAPTPFSNPYDATIDRNGDVWAGGEFSDRILRLDPQTGEFIEYGLPGFVNVRRVFVDNRAEPVAFWVGANHTASIIKLEPLDTAGSMQ